MCLFAGGIERVSNTRIFAAPGPGARQRLVYSMALETAGSVAMILPLPLAPDAGKDGIRFIDLSGYAAFFDDLADLFGVMTLGAAGAVGEGVFDAGPIPVQQVGEFEASYVPSHDDWDRLDARFRLDPALWEQLPQYHDHGFAVFQLAPAARGGTQRIHPMAFDFATRTPGELFFPTVHIHDGQVHAEADFDHDLYCQLPAGHGLLESLGGAGAMAPPEVASDWMEPALVPDGWEPEPVDWMLSMELARDRIDLARSAALVDGSAPVLLRQLHGRFPNRDIVVPATG